jgi:hypothetical protein
MEHFTDVFDRGKADAALAASIFHFHQIDLPRVEDFFAESWYNCPHSAGDTGGVVAYASDFAKGNGLVPADRLDSCR